jgi:hypothetical protein
LSGLDGGVPEPIAEEGRLILITTVDIGDGKSDKIEVRAGDDPLDLARDFVSRHGLPDAIVEALGQHLRDNLRDAAAAQEAQGGWGHAAEDAAAAAHAGHRVSGLRGERGPALALLGARARVLQVCRGAGALFAWA